MIPAQSRANKAALKRAKEIRCQYATTSFILSGLVGLLPRNAISTSVPARLHTRWTVCPKRNRFLPRQPSVTYNPPYLTWPSGIKMKRNIGSSSYNNPRISSYWYSRPAF